MKKYQICSPCAIGNAVVEFNRDSICMFYQEIISKMDYLMREGAIFYFNQEEIEKYSELEFNDLIKSDILVNAYTNLQSLGEMILHNIDESIENAISMRRHNPMSRSMF